MKIYLTMAALTMMCKSAFAEPKSTCGINSVSKIGANKLGRSFQFDSTKPMKITVDHKSNTTAANLNPKATRNKEGNVTSIEIMEDERLYITDGKKIGCIASTSVRDGVSGLQIEMHIFEAGKPPVSDVQFISNL